MNELFFKIAHPACIKLPEFTIVSISMQHDNNNVVTDYVEVSIKDETGSASGKFEVSKLEMPSAEQKMRTLWGDFLQSKSHNLLKSMSDEKPLYKQVVKESVEKAVEKILNQSSVHDFTVKVITYNQEPSCFIQIANGDIAEFTFLESKDVVNPEVLKASVHALLIKLSRKQGMAQPKQEVPDLVLFIKSVLYNTKVKKVTINQDVQGSTTVSFECDGDS